MSNNPTFKENDAAVFQLLVYPEVSKQHGVIAFEILSIK